MELRNYQRELMHSVHRHLRDGRRRICCTAPTGAGKTVIMSAWCESAVRQDRRVLVIADRRLLVSQAWRTMDREGIHTGQIMAGEPYEPDCPVQIASLATLRSRQRLCAINQGNRSLYFPPADLILVDEAHKAGFGRVVREYPGAIVIGMTATPVDATGCALWGPNRDYEALAQSATNSSLIGAGWLLRTRVWAPSEPDVVGVSFSGAEYNQKQLGERVTACTAFANILDEWRPHMWRKTIVFAPSVSLCYGLQEDFERVLGQGRVYVIDASTKKDRREEILDEMARGNGQVLLSVDVLREGFDLPIASCAIDLQPNRKLRTYWQKIGRIKRLYPGQDHCVWLDMAGNYWRHTDPNGDPDWESLDQGGTIDDPKPREPGEPEPVRCPRCGYVFSEPVRNGTVCPNCGHEFDSRIRIRKVRQGDGRLVEVTVRDKVEKSAERKREDEWIGMLYMGWYRHMSFNQCAALYKRRYGAWPDRGWFCRPKDGFDGATKVHHRFERKADIYKLYMEGKGDVECPT